MDPVTIIGLLASLSSLIQASGSVILIIQTYKDGDTELDDLSNDISVFAEALKGFDRVLRSRQTMPRISGSVTRNALEAAGKTMKNLENRIQHLSEYETSVVRRMKWVQHKSSVKKLHERLKEHNAMLQTFVALTHAYVSRSPLRIIIKILSNHLEKHFSQLLVNIHSSSYYVLRRKRIWQSMASQYKILFYCRNRSSSPWSRVLPYGGTLMPVQSRLSKVARLPWNHCRYLAQSHPLKNLQYHLGSHPIPQPPLPLAIGFLEQEKGLPILWVATILIVCSKIQDRDWQLRFLRRIRW